MQNVVNYDKTHTELQLIFNFTRKMLNGRICYYLNKSASGVGSNFFNTRGFTLKIRKM